jgi:hypothetical protein
MTSMRPPFRPFAPFVPSTTHLARAHVLSAALAFAAGVAACGGCRSSGTPINPVQDGQNANAGTPTLRLYLVTDLAGALEPCGCTKDQLGGLNHFGAWVKQSTTHAPAAIVASSGPLFFMDDKLSGERADQDRLKADAIARVLHGLAFAAFAPGQNDWDDGAEGLTKLGGASGASTILADGKAFVREVGGVRVGFIGYGQAGPAAPSTNVQDVVRRGVDDAKKQGAEVLIALAAVGRGEAKRIADAVPELTAVVVGSARSTGEGNTTSAPAEQVGDVLIVQAANHLQSVGVLDLYVRESLSPGRIVRFADATGLELARKREDLARRIDDLHVKLASWARDPKIAPGDVEARRNELGRLEAERDSLDARPPPAKGSFFRYTTKEIRDALGTDASIDANLAAYYKAVNEHNRLAFADRSPSPAAPGEATYVGIDACSNCHAEPRQVWNRTSHASAYATIATQFKEFNLECVSCHVTGYERPGGSTVTHVEKLKDVQCEVCHGPGSKHVRNPTDRAAIIAKPALDTCTTCHHPPHVEDFDPSVKVKEILGPGHGMSMK